MAYTVAYTPEPVRPSGGVRVGTARLQVYVCDRFARDAGVPDVITDLGTYAPRDICGNYWPGWKCTGSQHASGRAGDSGVPLTQRGRDAGDALAKWLVKSYTALGIQEVIWYGKRWTNQTLRWVDYHGPSPHRDHVHWAQSAIPASRLTDAQIAAAAPGEPPPPPAPLEDDVFYWEYKHGTGSAAVMVMVQTTGKGSDRITGQAMTDRCRNGPHYTGVADPGTKGRWLKRHGPVAGAP